MKTSYKCCRGVWMACIGILLLSSCDRFEYNPYDTQYLDDTHINQTNINRIEGATTTDDTLRFVFVGDTQRMYDETEAFVKDVNKLQNIDFVIHGGDITDFGLSKEYKWMHEILKKLKVPYVTLIGNHDVVGHGKDVFQEVYGDLNFSFTSHKTRFVCLNTNALEFDYSTPVPDFDFMLQQVADSADIDQTIVVMHAPPFDEQFNNNVTLMFNYVVEQYKNLRFCLHAHQHSLKETDFFNNGIMYYGCDDISGRNYMIFTVTPDSYTYTVKYY